MSRWLVVWIAGVGCLALLGLVTLVILAEPEDPPRIPILVELFTSEGCASCPPADELLIRLHQEQYIPGVLVIPLSEHVEYWNGNWRDPFSLSVFTDRQRSYHKILGSRLLYTPEMVVDGRRQFVGSQRMMAEHAILHAARMPKAAVELAIEPDAPAEGVVVQITVSDVLQLGVSGPIDLMLAVTEDGLETDVQFGENARRRLRHAAVVRHLERIETFDVPGVGRFAASAEVILRPEWQRLNLRIVVFLQESTSRHVFGAAQIEVN